MIGLTAILETQGQKICSDEDSKGERREGDTEINKGKERKRKIQRGGRQEGEQDKLLDINSYITCMTHNIR